MEVLAPALAKCRNLKILQLGGNNIGNEGCIALSSNMPSNLEVLDLRRNNIGDRGCVALGENLPRSVQELNLVDNLIYVKGCTAVLKLLESTGNSLVQLSMRENPGFRGLLRTRFEQVEIEKREKELVLEQVFFSGCFCFSNTVDEFLRRNLLSCRGECLFCRGHIAENCFCFGLSICKLGQCSYCAEGVGCLLLDPIPIGVKGDDICTLNLLFVELALMIPQVLCKYRARVCCCVSGGSLPATKDVPSICGMCFISCYPEFGVCKKVSELTGPFRLCRGATEL